MADSRRVGEQTVFVYQSVIDDVIARVKPEFIQEGVDESVLDELRSLWEAKLVQTGVLGNPNQAEVAQAIGTAGQARPAAAGVATAAAAPAVGLPAAMPQYRQQAAMPGPQMLTTHQYQLPPQQPQQWQQQLQGMSQLMHPQQQMLQQQVLLQQQQRQQQQQQQARYVVPPGLPMAAQAFAAPQPAAAAAAAALDDRKRKLEGLQGNAGGPPVKREQLAGMAVPGVAGLPQQVGLQPRPSIPQQDGPGDEGEEKEGGEEAGEPEEALGADDDLVGLDDEEVDEEQLKDVVLGQFDKVSRTKARWKVQLKDLIITANGRDYLVHKANGEMNF